MMECRDCGAAFPALFGESRISAMRYIHKRKHGERVHFFHPGQTRPFKHNKHKETSMGIGKRIVSLTCFTMLVAAGIPSSHAQEKWPVKPITYVVPFAAGGTT